MVAMAAAAASAWNNESAATLSISVACHKQSRLSARGLELLCRRLERMVTTEEKRRRSGKQKEGTTNVADDGWWTTRANGFRALLLLLPAHRAATP